MRRAHSPQSGINLIKAKSNVHYAGLMTCGSIWVCPVCAAKISERRRTDMKLLVAQARLRGYTVLLLTQTVPHYSNQALKPLLSHFAQARSLQRHRGSWKKIVDRFGIMGTVRALEVTHGENGWHIHTHELLFIAPGHNINPAMVSAYILPTWQRACVSAGLGEPNKHGVDVKDGSAASDYIGKWGIEEEVTKSHIKQGRADSQTPFDFLRDYLATGDEDAADLFRDYAKAFRGKKQLTWSRGLRDHFDLEEELTDEEIAEKKIEDGILLGNIDMDQWRLILKHDKRGQILQIAKDSGFHGVLSYLSTLD